MRGRKRELVEVVLDGLDLAVVADLVPKPEESVLDDAADLRRRVELTDWQLVARQGDVEAVRGQGPVELSALELRLALRERLLQPFTDRVERHTGPPVADVPKRLLQLALPPEVARAQLGQLVRGRRSRQAPESLFLQGRRV